MRLNLLLSCEHSPEQSCRQNRTTRSSAGLYTETRAETDA